MKNITEMLEKSALKFPDKPAFRDSASEMTYQTLADTARRIGSFLAGRDITRSPVAIMTGRSVKTPAAMFGCLYGGNFYTVIDTEMPAERIKNILDTLCPAAVIVSEEYAEKLEQTGYGGFTADYGQAAAYEPDMPLLKETALRAIDTDPAYVLFTSGSTGRPKGAVVSHRSVIAYINWFSKTFGIDENTVFGSQTPFYFSMSVSDVFSAVFRGASMDIIPKELFSFPMKLIEFLNARKVNTVYWVPSALSIIANWRVLDYAELKYIKKVLFAGEVMPVRQLNYWIKKLPGAMFANFFGPTETTDICTYYKVDREFSDGESLPIGRHCDNCDVFVVKEDGTEAAPGEEGELYARGSFLALGYYNDPEKTAAAFVQNPLNKSYPETVYKTGDLVKYNEKGELMYITRADFQIKRMGYRIELGEIEAAASAVSGINSCAAVYDRRSDKIVLFCTGREKDGSVITSELSGRLPDYMMPQKVILISTMPLNANGKIDRRMLAESCGG